jgi:hypothetical protein
MGKRDPVSSTELATWAAMNFHEQEIVISRPQADLRTFARKRPLVAACLSYRESNGLVTDRVTCSTWV